MNINEKQLIFGCVFGSHLYGTNVETSDRDYKWVYVPTKEQIILKNGTFIVNNHKTDSGDDNEYIDLLSFLRMLYRGDTVAIEMLHVPKDKILLTTPEFNHLIENRKDFYTKNMNGIIGYIRKQAGRFSVKSERLQALIQLIAHISHMNMSADKMKSIKIVNLKGHLPDNELTGWWTKVNNGQQELFYQILGRSYVPNTSLYDLYNVAMKIRGEYGSRAHAAANMRGADYKAISHAFRSALQLTEIYETRDLKFPSDCADWLRDVRLGKYDFVRDLQENLEVIMNKLDALKKSVDLPDHVDVKKWDKWLVNVYWMHISK